MRPRLLAASLLTLALAVTTPAAAQGDIEHGGFYFGVGLGYGWASYGGDIDLASDDGFAGHLRLGGHLKPNLLLGFESNGWYGSGEGIKTFFGSGMATGTFYPSRSTPVFVKGGLGYMYTLASEDNDELTSTHFAFQLGVGYDIQVGRNTAITLVGNWIKGMNGQLEFDGIDLGDVSPSVFQLGVAFSLY